MITLHVYIKSHSEVYICQVLHVVNFDIYARTVKYLLQMKHENEMLNVIEINCTIFFLFC